MDNKVKGTNKLGMDFKAFIAFIAFSIMFGATYLITTELADNGTIKEEWMLIAIQVITYVIYLVVLFTTVLRETLNRIIWTLKNEHQKVIKSALIATLVYLLLSTGVNGLWKIIIENTTDKTVGSSANQGAIDGIFKSGAAGAFIMAITTIVIGPITEEVAFRKGIIGATSRTDSKFFRHFMIALSIFLFGAMHVFIGGDWQNIVPYLLMGSVLAYVYNKYNDNITYTIMTHMFVNTFSVIMMMIVK